MPAKTSSEMVVALDTRTARQAWVDLFAFAVGVDEAIADVATVQRLVAWVDDVTRERVEHPADAFICLSPTCPRVQCAKWRFVAAHVVRE